VAGRHEVSPEGKALRYFEVTTFREELTPERIAEAVKSLTAQSKA
jgi:hypothetical protein